MPKLDRTAEDVKQDEEIAEVKRELTELEKRAAEEAQKSPLDHLADLVREYEHDVKHSAPVKGSFLDRLRAVHEALTK